MNRALHNRRRGNVANNAPKCTDSLGTMIQLRGLAALVFCVLLLMTTAACSTQEQIVKSRLSKLLATHGYSLYFPFRSEDKPGTLFVLATNHNRKYTEFTVSEYGDTFDVPGKILFDPEGQQLAWANELKESFKFSGSAALDLSNAAISAGVSGENIESITMTFGDMTKKYVLPFSRLAAHKDDLNDDVRASLKALKDNGQLNQVYLVMEVLEVSSVNISVSFKRGFKATADFEKVKAIAKGNLKLEITKDGSLSIQRNRVTLIGYKARSFPETILRDEVSAPALTEGLLEASHFNRIKGR